MIAHKSAGGSWWERTTICGKILTKDDLTDEYTSTVWKNVTCDHCKNSSYYKEWSKRVQK
jgi:hypothetical protein